MRVTGRSKFEKYKKVIILFSKFLRLLGKRCNLFMFNCFKNTGGTIGILLRYVLLCNIAKKVGDNVSIQPYCVIKNVENIEFGSNVSIHSFCYIEGIGGIVIGNDVSIAHSSTLISSNHTWDDKQLPIKYNKEIFEKIVLEEDIWIGCGVRVLAGVHIGKRSVLAAGAIVNKNVESEVLVGGVPARIIKRI